MPGRAARGQKRSSYPPPSPPASRNHALTVHKNNKNKKLSSIALMPAINTTTTSTTRTGNKRCAAGGGCFRIGRPEAQKACARGREPSRPRSFHHPGLGSSHLPSPTVASEEARSRRPQAPVGARDTTNCRDPYTGGSARGDGAAGALEGGAGGCRHPAGGARAARTVGGERACAHEVCMRGNSFQA